MRRTPRNEPQFRELPEFLLVNGGKADSNLLVIALGITRNQRVVSRALFYAGVAMTAWVIGAMSPQPADGRLSDEDLGAAKAYIASPFVPDGADSKRLR